MSEIYLPDCQRVCMPGARVALSDALEIMTEEWIVGGQYADQTVIDLRDATAALLASHNALREAVAWERECRDANMGGVISYATHHLWLTHGEDYLDAIQEDYEAICDAARAEVDRLLKEPTP